MIKRLILKNKKKPATFWKRLLAYLIDIVIINLVIVIPFENYLKEYQNIGFDLFLKTAMNKNFISITLAIVIFTLLYFVILEFKYKQTLGKMFLGIYVESLKGNISLQQVILRNITKPFSAVLLVDVIYMFFKRGHQRLFEVFSGTQVVEEGVVLK